MKYNSLKKQTIKSVKVAKFDGGFNLKEPNFNIENNQLSDGCNMWFKDSRLRSRPGLSGDKQKAVRTEINGYTGELKYNMTDTEVYYNESYHRIATADVLTDDYAHYTYVYLVDLLGNIKPIGNMGFFRITGDIFYTPINTLFYNGKSETGGGIFALVTVQNGWNQRERNYHVYEINKEFTEWNRVYDYYIPTISINGRGNLYDKARLEESFSAPAPKNLESPNLLNGKFHAYYTSDGFSSSFRLPFSNLSSGEVVCRIYYTLLDYTEWRINADATSVTQPFQNTNVTATVDRTKGMVYFTMGSIDYSVPVMPKYHENNIRITATKEIPNGFAKAVYSTCSIKNNSKLFLAGGESGNTVITTSYENPLYFPLGSSVDVGEADSEINALSVQKGKILAFKSYEIYALDFKVGDSINEVSLLSDNDAVFKNFDSIKVSQISDKIGCKCPRSIAVCNNTNYWLSDDNCIYALESVASQKIVNVSQNIAHKMPRYNEWEAFAVGNDEFYFLISGQEIVVVDVKTRAIFYWMIPMAIKLQSGFYHKGKFRFLCTSPDSTIAYMTTLDGDKDTYMFYSGDGSIATGEILIESVMITKHFHPVGLSEKMNIDNIYLSVSTLEKAEIAVNSKERTSINFGFLGEDYNKHEYKTVRIIPHLYGVDEIYLTISADNPISIGETEIYYRITR